MRIKFKNIFTLAIIVVLIGIMIDWFSPYKFTKNLPKVNASDVESIKIWVDSIDKNFIMLKPSENEKEIEKIINMYNQVKEVKSQIGTTPDVAIIINLRDKDKITIWNLYSREWVTIGYRNSRNKYYQTNVESKELASYIENIRQEKKQFNSPTINSADIKVEQIIKDHIPKPFDPIVHPDRLEFKGRWKG